MKNKYIRRARISEAKFRKLVKCFALDLAAQKIAVLTSLNRNTVNRYLKLIRKQIADFCEKDTSFICTLIEDTTDTQDKDIVLGVVLKKSKIYTEIVPEDLKATCRGLIQGSISCEMAYRAQNWRDYDCLIDFNRKKYFRTPREELNMHRPEALSRIESFWSYLKKRLMKFNGVPRSTFYLHLKESEFRFNNAGENIYNLLLRMFRENPIGLESLKG